MSSTPGMGLVRRAAWLVPWRRRDEWLAEWEAELAYTWQAGARGSRDAVRLRWRALGALRDALEMRRQYGGYSMLGTEIGYAVRMLLRRPRFAAAVVLTLALGVAGTAVVYTLLERLVLRPADFANVERVVELHTVVAPGTAIPVLTADGVREWAEQGNVFEEIQAYGSWSEILTGVGEPQQTKIALVTPGLLQMLGVRPLVGRLPAASPDAAGEIVIAESLWRNELGQRDDVVGMPLQLAEASYTVVGVLPASFRYPVGEPRIWRTAALGTTGMLQVQAVARVPEGRTREQVEAEVARTGERMKAEGKGGGLPPVLELRWLADSQLPPELQRALWVLATAVGLVLLIACVNAANLLLVDTARRDHELAIRGALGATRVELMRQLVLESLVLALVSAAVALVMARWLLGAVLALAPEELTLGAFRTPQIDVRAVVFATVVAVGAAVLYSLFASLWATRSADLVHAPRTTHSRAARSTRSVLVVSEVALSVVLVTGAGLLLNSFVRLTRTDLGFEPRGLIEFTVVPRQGGETFMRDLEERLTALPQVRALARANAAPSVVGMAYMGYVLQPFGMPDDEAVLRPGRLPVVQMDSGYLGVLGAALREGRNLIPADAENGGVLIDEDLARHLWPTEPAVGKRFRTGRNNAPWWHVVGVTENIRILGADDSESPFLVMTQAPQTRRGSYFVMRVAGDPHQAADDVRDVLRQLDPGLPVPTIRHVPESMRGTFAERRFLMLLIGGFAIVSTLLAIIGLYGVIAHTVAQRTREIGIRMALGARRIDVIGDVVGSGAVLTAIGVLIGLAGALFATRLLGSLLFGVDPRDAPTFAAVALGVSIIGLLAAWIPARRAARIDPLQALRHD